MDDADYKALFEQLVPPTAAEEEDYGSPLQATPPLQTDAPPKVTQGVRVMIRVRKRPVDDPDPPCIKCEDERHILITAPAPEDQAPKTPRRDVRRPGFGRTPGTSGTPGYVTPGVTPGGLAPGGTPGGRAPGGTPGGRTHARTSTPLGFARSVGRKFGSAVRLAADAVAARTPGGRAVAPQPSPTRFVFDAVCGEMATQENVFAQAQPYVDALINGENSCIVAYGQTGTGKTHTMHGTADSPGVIPRAFELLFHHINDSTGTTEWHVRATFVRRRN